MSLTDLRHQQLFVLITHYLVVSLFFYIEKKDSKALSCVYAEKMKPWVTVTCEAEHEALEALHTRPMPAF